MKVHVKINGMKYVLVCDYYVPEAPFLYDGKLIGYYGNKRLGYLMNEKPELYLQLKESGKLFKQLVETNSRVIKEKRMLLDRMIGTSEPPLQSSQLHEICLQIELHLLSNLIYI